MSDSIRLVFPDEIHIFLHHVGETAQLTAISTKLDKLIKGNIHMSAELDALKAKVEANGSVGQSAVMLLTELKAKIDAGIASGDPAALQALSDELGAQTQALADAIVANTPAAP